MNKDRGVVLACKTSTVLVCISQSKGGVCELGLTDVICRVLSEIICSIRVKDFESCRTKFGLK